MEAIISGREEPRVGSIRSVPPLTRITCPSPRPLSGDPPPYRRRNQPRRSCGARRGCWGGGVSSSDSRPHRRGGVTLEVGAGKWMAAVVGGAEPERRRWGGRGPAGEPRPGTGPFLVGCWLVATSALAEPHAVPRQRDARVPFSLMRWRG
ncbi:hypothetical protein BS78_05G129500 [Paspalum vaginatum]|nr:hypothetical protein BS78_05G129500 [Paspalum vaginatum]